MIKEKKIIEIIFIFILFITLHLFAAQICEKCKYSNNPDSAKYCLQCAESLESILLCPYCNFNNHAGDQYCLNCNKDIESFVIQTSNKITENVEENSNSEINDLAKSEKDVIEKDSFKDALFKRFQNDYKNGSIKKYSINELLTLMGLKGEVQYLVKAGKSNASNVPTVGTFISTVLVDHYKSVPVRDAVLWILQERCKKNSFVYQQLFSALSNFNPEIRAAAIHACSYVDTMKNESKLNSKLVSLLKDRNSKVKKVALYMIINKYKNLVEDSRVPDSIFEIIMDSSMDIETRKSACFSISSILQEYAKFPRYLEDSERKLQSTIEYQEHVKQTIKKLEEERSKVNYNDSDTKSNLDKRINREKEDFRQKNLEIVEIKNEINEYKNKNQILDAIKNKAFLIFKKISINSSHELNKTSSDVLEDIMKLFPKNA